jgi:hypothetical protein
MSRACVYVYMFREREGVIGERQVLEDRKVNETASAER